jgi:hypothetical protein
MNRTFVFIILVCLVSCKDNPTHISIGNMRRPSELLRYTVFSTENEKNLSFPLLFDKKVIRLQGIKQIIRRHYIIDTTEIASGKILRDERHYRFENGNIIASELFNYYDNRQIGRMKIGYTANSIANGFKEGYIYRDSGAVKNNEFLESGFQAHRLYKLKRRYISFTEKTSGSKLFYMINKSYWGPLSVDSILHPTPNDLIVLGSPLYPVKSYRVENKIKEKDVTSYIYHPYLRRIQRIIKEDFPFTTKRTFFYDNEGYCSGYNDSTFSSKKFLVCSDTRIKLNARKLPLTITQKKHTAFRNLGLTSIEQFEYRY